MDDDDDDDDASAYLNVDGLHDSQGGVRGDRESARDLGIVGCFSPQCASPSPSPSTLPTSICSTRQAKQGI